MGSNSNWVGRFLEVLVLPSSRLEIDVVLVSGHRIKLNWMVRRGDCVDTSEVWKVFLVHQVMSKCMKIRKVYVYIDKQGGKGRG